MGVPVVSTALPEIERFNQEHGQLVLTAFDADAFARALVAAGADQSPSRAAERRRVAAANDWSIRLDAMSALITGALTPRRARKA